MANFSPCPLLFLSTVAVLAVSAAVQPSLTKSTQDPLLNLSARSCSFPRGIRPPQRRCNNILETRKNNVQPRSSRFLSPDSRPAMTSPMATRKPPRRTPRMKNGTVLMTWALVSNISMMMMMPSKLMNARKLCSQNAPPARYLGGSLCQTRMSRQAILQEFRSLLHAMRESVQRVCPCQLNGLLGGSPNACPRTLSPDCQTSPLDSRIHPCGQHPLNWDGGWDRRNQWFVVGICACPTTRRPKPWCGL